MSLRHRIGLLYIPGALPCFENFGNLPTDLVYADAKVDNKPASEVLDMLIIPGGSLVESQSVTPDVKREIVKMADCGKFVLGICSGFQILSKHTDVGRLSTIPIIREGIGLLDVEFKPLICTDQVKATVVDTSFLTQEIGKDVQGFHCHTYGQINLQKNVKPILVSHVNQINYKRNPQDLLSGVSNKQGNIVGVLIHSLLDNNPTVLESIMKSVDINQTELLKIREANSNLLSKIKNEIGVSTGIYSNCQIKQHTPLFLMFTALGSGSGKTFIVSGIAGALKKRGFRVGIIKVAGDIRDTVPALYLIKEPIKEYSSIKIGESGWLPLDQVVEQSTKNHDFLLVEGAMSAFTGLLNENYQRPMSTVEVAVALGAPSIVIAACDQDGLEGALINTLNYLRTMKKLGINVKGVILNKLYISYITDEIKLIMKTAFSQLGVELLGMVPRLSFERRGMIPEVEIRYEDFGSEAMKAVEHHIDLDLLVKTASPAQLTQVDYDAITAEFRKILTHSNLNE